MDNKEMEKKELTPEKLDQVSGGLGTDLTVEQLQEMLNVPGEIIEEMNSPDKLM